MGRASRCIHNLFTKPTSETQTNPQKPKWIITLLKSCKNNNSPATTNSLVSIERRQNNHEPSASNGYNNRDYSHCKAVADASNTAAEAAVVAVQAAVEVVRIVTSGRFNFDPSHSAAVRIQSVFRGYLARKALRALRALVRLQALVRGYIVRKRAVDQVQRMHALIRAQARARAIRAPVPASSYSSSRTTHSCILDPPTPEDSVYAAQVCKSLPDKIKLGSGRVYSRRFDEGNSDKIVEVDSYTKPCISTKNKNLFVLPDYSHQNSYQTPPVQHTSEDLYLHYSSEIDRYSYYTADNILPLHPSSFRSRSARRGGNIEPRDLERSGRYESGFQDHPNYMAYTKSSKAKMRSLSAPRQRTQLDRSTSQKSYSSHDYGLRRFSIPSAS